MTGKERLDAAHFAWVDGGSQSPDAKEAKRAVDAYAKADKAVTLAEKELNRARAARSTAVEGLVRIAGRGRLDLGKLGVQIPMARGDSLFMKPERASNARKVL